MGLIKGNEWILTILFLGILITPMILYLISLRKTILAIAPENRALHPNDVWFILIPIWGIFNYYKTVDKIGDSLHNEFKTKEIDTFEKFPGRITGSLAFLFALGFFTIGIFSRAIIVLLFLFIPMFTLWILHWIQIIYYRKKINKR
ncbi:hypothetical protein OBK14_09415 [Empedobacter falsenii]